MGELTRWDRDTEERTTRALARQLGSMELATTVVKAGIVEVGSAHRAAAAEVARTLKVAESMVKSAAYAGRLTPDKERTVRRLTEGYLDDMLTITDDCANEIIDVLLDL